MPAGPRSRSQASHARSRSRSAAIWASLLVNAFQPVISDDTRRPMSAITLDRSAADRIRFEAEGVVLAEYVHQPTEERFESPRPYLSPIRTRGGELVSLF